MSGTGEPWHEQIVRWASALSEASNLEAAVDEATLHLVSELGSAEPQLIVAFISPHHEAAYDALPALVRARFPQALLYGCSAAGVIGNGHEVEHRPGLSLTAAILPGVTLTTLHAEAPDPDTHPEAWRARLGPDPADDPCFLVLDDPFTCDTEVLLQHLDRAYPLAPKAGGLASAAQEPGHNALFLGDQVHRSGAAILALTGALKMDTAVAQGCRPVGEPMIVTSLSGNVIRQFDRGTPLEAIRAVHDTLQGRDRELFQHSLFLGIQMRDKKVYEAGDFLIRNIIGIDPKSGAMAIAARIAPYAVVQFHLRDAQTSNEDLRAVLDRHHLEMPTAPSGALLFSCVGRGEHLYGKPDNDTGVLGKEIGAVPLGGFFCHGEIGPVGDRTFLHGYTSSFALFRPR